MTSSEISEISRFVYMMQDACPTAVRTATDTYELEYFRDEETDITRKLVMVSCNGFVEVSRKIYVGSVLVENAKLELERLTDAHQLRSLIEGRC